MTAPSQRPSLKSVDSVAADSTPELKTFEVEVATQLDRLPYGSYKAFGRALSRSDTWVGRMRDPFDTTHIRASQVGVACQAVGSVEPLNVLLADVRIAGRRWHVVPMPEVVASTELVMDGVTASAAVSKLVAELVGALADRRLDGREKASLEAALVEAHEQVLGLLAGVRGAA